MRILLLALLLPLAWPGPAPAHELRIGVAALATSADPHFYNLAANNALAAHIFGRLTQRGPDGTLQPDLALRWTPVADTVWEFALRPGVRWHDGSPFTADDVAFSFARAPIVPNSPSSFAGMLRAITRVEVVDPLTLRLHTAAPAPTLPNDLAIVSIVSRHAGEGAATEQYDAGPAAIGTGPYRLERFVRNERAVLVRNPDWWGPAPAWARVTIRPIGNPAARTAALLAGDVDLIDAIPTNDLPALRTDRRVAVWSAPGLRVLFLGPDATRTGPDPFVTGAGGQPLPASPLQDRRVRQALSAAIDRTGLVQRVMEGAAAPTGQWMPPGLPGFLPDRPVPAFDPARARRLLADAGYQDGFHLVLHAPTDRYPNGPAIAQAVAAMWTRAGIPTRVELLPGALYSPRGVRHEFAMGLWSWSNGTAEAGYALVNMLGTQNGSDRGVSNVAGYSNPQLDRLTDQALATIDPAARGALLRQAMALAVDDEAYIMLLHYKNAWATRAGLRYEARSDDLTLATGTTPAP